jgi:hypothetical protein
MQRNRKQQQPHGDLDRGEPPFWRPLHGAPPQKEVLRKVFNFALCRARAPLKYQGFPLSITGGFGPAGILTH